MKIAIGSDHRGFHTKERLRTFLTDLGHEVTDCGTSSDASADYPDFAVPVGLLVAQREADRGILMCGSGIGMTMTANKVSGVRAALCHDELTAEMSRRHNDANVLCLAADLLGDELIKRMVEVWLAAPFDAGRHSRRVQKIMAAEQVRPTTDEAAVPTACRPAAAPAKPPACAPAAAPARPPAAAKDKPHAKAK